MAWRRCVLPRPDSPWMTSGLYDLPGASATATAAAWAKRLDDPMTKFSKRYRGLSRASAALPRLIGTTLVRWAQLGTNASSSSSSSSSARSGRLELRRRKWICRQVVLCVWRWSGMSVSTSVGSIVTMSRISWPMRLGEGVLEGRPDARLELRPGEVVLDGDDQDSVVEAEWSGVEDPDLGAGGEGVDRLLPVGAELDILRRIRRLTHPGTSVAPHGYPHNVHRHGSAGSTVEKSNTAATLAAGPGQFKRISPSC